MLRWLWSLLVGFPTSQTRAGHDSAFVTRDELEEALAEHMKEVTFEWNEAYEKFSALHLRLSKRVKREKEPVRVINGEPTAGDDRQQGVLALRRMGSV